MCFLSKDYAGLPARSRNREQGPVTREIIPENGFRISTRVVLPDSHRLDPGREPAAVKEGERPLYAFSSGGGRAVIQ